MDARARRVLNREGIEVVRSKYKKEIKVTGDPGRKIAFGDDQVALGDVEEWLSRNARADLSPFKDRYHFGGRGDCNCCLDVAFPSRSLSRRVCHGCGRAQATCGGAP